MQSMKLWRVHAVTAEYERHAGSIFKDGHYVNWNAKVTWTAGLTETSLTAVMARVALTRSA